MEFNSVFIGALAGVAPALAGWTAVIVLAAIILRRRGGRAERFLVAGASLKLLSCLLNVPAAGIAPWLIHGGASVDYVNSVVTGFGILRGVVSMAGVICLVYAFWVKFKAMNIEALEPTTKEELKETAP
jgi:hypothetical protein